MERDPTTYAWSLHSDQNSVAVEHLAAADQHALACAQELAHAARARSRQNLRRDRGPAPITIAALAKREGLSVSTLRRRISHVRRELFGDLTDAAIYKRRQRRQRLSGTPARRCKHPGCTDNLAARAHGNQQYCSRHRTPAQRTRRHRQQAATTTNGQKRP